MHGEDHIRHILRQQSQEASKRGKILRVYQCCLAVMHSLLIYTRRDTGCKGSQSVFCGSTVCYLTSAEFPRTVCLITIAQSSSSPLVAAVSVHALSCGHFTLPEHQFVKPSSLDARRTVPSLAFLIRHVNRDTGKRTNILFDLGLRGDLNAYPAPVKKHIETRRPIDSRPDVVENLAKGGLRPKDIGYVILSHVCFAFLWHYVQVNERWIGTLGPHRHALLFSHSHLHCRSGLSRLAERQNAACKWEPFFLRV
jgi:hypothetical protein